MLFTNTSILFRFIILYCTISLLLGTSQKPSVCVWHWGHTSCLKKKVKVKVKVKANIALPGNPISELWDITCHMGSQCYLPPDTSERAQPNLTMQAGTQFTYPGGMEGWIDLVDLIAPRPVVDSATFWSRVQRPNHCTKERLNDAEQWSYLYSTLRTIRSTRMIHVGFFASADAAIHFSKQLPVDHLKQHHPRTRVHYLLSGSTIRLVFPLHPVIITETMNTKQK